MVSSFNFLIYKQNFYFQYSELKLNFHQMYFMKIVKAMKCKRYGMWHRLGKECSVAWSYGGIIVLYEGFLGEIDLLCTIVENLFSKSNYRLITWGGITPRLQPYVALMWPLVTYAANFIQHGIRVKFRVSFLFHLVSAPQPPTSSFRFPSLNATTPHSSLSFSSVERRSHPQVPFHFTSLSVAVPHPSTSSLSFSSVERRSPQQLSFTFIPFEFSTFAISRSHPPNQFSFWIDPSCHLQTWQVCCQIFVCLRVMGVVNLWLCLYCVIYVYIVVRGGD